MKKGLLLSIFLMLTLLGFAEKPLKIAYFIPRQVEGDMFYNLVGDFAKKAAEDLNIDLDFYEAKGNHILMARQGELASKKNYDAFMVINVKFAGSQIVKSARNERIPVLFENGGILSKKVGEPREKNPYYIGEIVPDDKNAGYKLGKYLIKKAKETGEKLEILGITGVKASSASIEREKGLKIAIGETNGEAVLKQVVSANWETNIAKQKFIGLKRRYPKVNIVWTASDGMGMGVVKGIKEENLIPNKDVFTGGVDWSAGGIESVMKNEFTATVGGHFMEGAWGLVILSDYLRGIDFKDEGLKMYTDMYLITPDNYEERKILFDKSKWGEIDFKRFSKYYSGISKYDFGIEKVIKELKK